MTGVVDARESTLLVPVPSAEDSVARFRKRLDPASRLGVPAHVSVLYPFAPPARLDDAAMERLSVIFEGVGTFDFELAHVGWFDERVLYLAPEPASTFVGITNALAAGFPDYPPYGGEFPEGIPPPPLGGGGARPRGGPPRPPGATPPPRPGHRRRGLAHGARRGGALAHTPCVSAGPGWALGTANSGSAPRSTTRSGAHRSRGGCGRLVG